MAPIRTTKPPKKLALSSLSSRQVGQTSLDSTFVTLDSKGKTVHYDSSTQKTLSFTAPDGSRVTGKAPKVNRPALRKTVFMPVASTSSLHTRSKPSPDMSVDTSGRNSKVTDPLPLPHRQPPADNPSTSISALSPSALPPSPYSTSAATSSTSSATTIDFIDLSDD